MSKIYLERRPEDKQKKDDIKNYTKLDMLEAFEHGLSHSPLTDDTDIDYEKWPEHNRPFWEWLAIRDKQV